MNPPIKNKVLRTCVSFLFVVYILVLIKVIILKNPGDLKTHFVDRYSWALVKTNISDANYVSFSTARYYINGTHRGRYSNENLLGNVLLFFPLGIFLPILFKTMNNLKRVLLTGFLVSFLFELIQLFTVLGNFDVDDILLNILGTMIGFGIYRSLIALSKARRPGMV